MAQLLFRHSLFLGLVLAVFGLAACAPGPYYGANDPYYDPYDYDRERYELERERDRLERERERLEEERERQRQPVYRPPPASPPPPRPVPERCPAGFSPSERKCSAEERRRGCRDIRLPGGLGCVSR